MYNIVVYFGSTEYVLNQVTEENFQKLVETKAIQGIFHYVDHWSRIHVLDMAKSTHFVAQA